MMRAFMWLIAIVALMWVIVAVNVPTGLIGLDLRDYGIKPRSWGGLWGVPLHVFLHAGFFHVFANTVPLLILGGLTAALRGKWIFLDITWFIAVIGGALVWILARPNTNHIGASGLVFGYFGYLVGRGFYTRSVVSILVAALVIAFYGGSILFGIIPRGDYISWEGHLFGLVAGALYAFMESRGNEREE